MQSLANTRPNVLQLDLSQKSQQITPVRGNVNAFQTIWHDRPMQKRVFFRSSARQAGSARRGTRTHKHWRPFFLAHDEKDNAVAHIIVFLSDKEIESNETYYMQ